MQLLLAFQWSSSLTLWLKLGYDANVVGYFSDSSVCSHSRSVLIYHFQIGYNMKASLNSSERSFYKY